MPSSTSLSPRLLIGSRPCGHRGRPGGAVAGLTPARRALFAAATAHSRLPARGAVRRADGRRGRADPSAMSVSSWRARRMGGTRSRCRRAAVAVERGRSVSRALGPIQRDGGAGQGAHGHGGRHCACWSPRAAALLPRLVPPALLACSVGRVEVGMEVPPADSGGAARRGGYSREDPVDEHGEFACGAASSTCSRPGTPQPVRIEFVGDSDRIPATVRSRHPALHRRDRPDPDRAHP